jgi:hypothetical protein
MATTPAVRCAGGEQLGQFGDANLDVVARLCRGVQVVGVPALLAPFHHHSLWTPTAGTALAGGPNTIVPTVLGRGCGE